MIGKQLEVTLAQIVEGELHARVSRTHARILYAE